MITNEKKKKRLNNKRARKVTMSMLNFIKVNYVFIDILESLIFNNM